MWESLSSLVGASGGCGSGRPTVAEERYEDVPIDELDEWLRRLIREEIAAALDDAADEMITTRAVATSLQNIAWRLRFVPAEG